MTITHAVSRNVDVSICLPRRTLNTAYDRENGGDNSVLYEDTPEERQKDLNYFLREYSDCYVYQEVIND